MNDKLLLALKGKNQGRPPVWFMRQAGRYLPSYQQIRARHPLYDLFFTPKLAAEITLQPIEQLGFDAAILFSDITVIAKALGFSLSFSEGPCLLPRIETPQQIDALPMLCVKEVLEPVFDAITMIKPKLSVPLIGFCGGPFTVATYLIEEGIRDISATKRFYHRYPEAFGRLLERLALQTIEYLDGQIDRGVQAVQIFESAAHHLSRADLKSICLPYHERLVRHVQRRNIPVISFVKGPFLLETAAMRPDAVSCDWQTCLQQARRLRPEIALQGNLDPDLLFAPLPVIEAKTRELLGEMGDDPAFILNLGHGVKPGTPVEAVRQVLKTIGLQSNLS